MLKSTFREIKPAVLPIVLTPFHGLIKTQTGMAGESLISNEMSKRIAEMIKVFIDRAKEKLEK